MISLHNARFTSLALLVSLIAAPFMVPTPALGANRMAVRAMQRGMQRKTLEYGFSLVDLIADNPWKSGLVAGGVTALLIYLISDTVYNKVNKGFGYVGGGFKKVGEGASWCGHQTKHQWKKRVKNYKKDPAALQALYKQQDDLFAAMKPRASVAHQETSKDLLNKANDALRKAGADKDYFEKNRPYISQGSMPLTRVDYEAQQKQEAQAKEHGEVERKAEAAHVASSSSVSILTTGNASSVQEQPAVMGRPAHEPVSESDLNNEEDRLSEALNTASAERIKAQERYDDDANTLAELKDLIETIEHRGGFSRADINKQNQELTQIDIELAEIERRMADYKAKGVDVKTHNELLKKRKELHRKIAEAEQKRRQAEQVTAQAEVPAHSMSQVHSGAAGSVVTESRETQAANLERPDSLSKMVAADASTSTLSSSSSASSGSTSSGR